MTKRIIKCITKNAYNKRFYQIRT